MSSDQYLKSALFAMAVTVGITTLFAADPGEASVPTHLFGGIQPRVSPDGQWIAVSYQGAIWQMPSNGGMMTRLTSEEGFDIEPVISPDGKTIAYINSATFFGGQLRLIKAGDGQLVKLPTAVRAEGRMFFHADGKRLLGRFSVTGPPDRLAWCDLETGLIKPLEVRPRESLPMRAPFCLSADGRSIVYAQHQDKPGEQSGNDGPPADLWHVAADGGDAQKIARWPARIYNLCFDASGKSVFAVTDRGVSHDDIWQIPLQDSLRDARKITSGQADEDWPSITGDGGVLVYTDNHEGATAIMRRELGSGQARALNAGRLDFRAPTGNVQIRLTDRSSGEALVGRLLIKKNDGKFYAPPGALYRVLGGRCFFYCRSVAELTLPVGLYEIAALRGPEYKAELREVEVGKDQSNVLEIAMERWVDAAAEGWYSGENHIHANYGYGAWYLDPRRTLEQCEGEDLNVCNIMVANSDGDGVFDREFFFGSPDSRSRPRTILYWNEEFRSTLWGHMTLINLERLVEPIYTGFKDTTNPWDVPTNGDIAQRTRHQQGVVSYTHPASNPSDLYDHPYSAKGLPVDAALEQIDTMDVMGFGYVPSVQLWYRLLNCGFRIPAAAGTDCFLNRITSYPPGWGRTYVKLPEGLSYKAWVDGQRVGRSFVSNGPVLDFSVEGKESGETISLDRPRAVRVRGHVKTQFPLEKVELIYNGSIVASGTMAGGRKEDNLDLELNVETSGWIALRVSGPSPPFLPVGGLWAHANPVFVQVKGRPLDAKQDAEYFLQWIDRLGAALRRRDRMHTGKSHIEMQLAAARSVYEKLAGKRK